MTLLQRYAFVDRGALVVSVETVKNVVNARGASTSDQVRDFRVDITRSDIPGASPLTLPVCDAIEQRVGVGSFYYVPVRRPVDSRYQVLDLLALNICAGVSIVNIEGCLSDCLCQVSMNDIGDCGAHTALISNREGAQEYRFLLMMKARRACEVCEVPKV
jgi:hypothetical protein